MGFFFTSGQKTKLKGVSEDFLRQHSCNVCPLDGAKLFHPKMEPEGTEEPIVLMVGGAPSGKEDELGGHGLGAAGKLLRSFFPEGWDDYVRWTNALRCHTHHPDPVALSCCYSKLEQDVVRTQPRAIFGFGNVPLAQIVKPASKACKISLWRGRRCVVNVGGHVCWYYPMLHPLDIIQGSYYREGSDEEFCLALDLHRAFSDLDVDLLDPVQHTEEEATAEIELVFDIDTIEHWLGYAASHSCAGVDIETNGFRPYAEGAKILTMAVSVNGGTFAFPVDHSGAAWSKADRERLDAAIKKFLYKSHCRKIVHHVSFELEWFGYFWGTGCFYSSCWDCSESAAYVLDPRRGGLSLDFLCLQHFGLQLKAISNLDRANLDKIPLDQVLKYNAIDARYHRCLWLALAREVEHRGLDDIYQEQLRRIPSLVLATLQGVPTDQGIVQKLKEKYEGRVKEAEEEIFSEVVVSEFEERKQRKFKPSSPLDVNFLVKEILGRKDITSTAKGELADINHPVAKKLIQYREASKILSTYILPCDANAEDTNIFPDGMLHPIISTTTVVSWRTSSDSPNIQNFPKRDDERKEVRAQIRHRDRNMQIVSFDYAGIQARNVAMESKDPKLVDAFWHNYDIHTDWMERIAKRYPRWIPKSKAGDKEALKRYRYLAKNKFVFPSFFGAQAYSMSESLGIPKEVCEDLREQFFAEFADIKKWHQDLDRHYYKHGFVTGLSGFHCHAPLHQNQRINYPIQGDEACIVMDAMCRLSEMEDPRYQPILMVHDDLTFCWPKEEIEKRAEVVIQALINVPFEWAKIVPIEVEMSVGDDWCDVNEVGKFSSNQWNGIVQIGRE